jgi:pyrroline-5-carboxylate reductase
MPNTPAMVGEGMFLFEETTSLSADELCFFKDLFGAIGTVMTLPSSLMGIGGAVSGCGPAFVDLMLEAFADAAVLYGLPRDKALALISTTVKGSAKLQLETGLHPGVLKDMVCSPAGSTIRGVAALEENGFRAACIAAIRAIMET